MHRSRLNTALVMAMIAAAWLPFISIAESPTYPKTPQAELEDAATGHGAVNRPRDTEMSDDNAAVDEGSRSALHGVLMYLPNRVFDLLDIFRLRVRVGPGFAAGARVTEAAAVYVGTYASVYAGLPGPRLRKVPRSPIGLESHNGLELSIADITADGGIGPGYSPTEVEGSVQAGIIGVDFGFDPVEFFDFFLGILTFDLRDDDL